MQNTAIAVSESTGLDAVLSQWTPELLRANIEREQSLRAIIVEYCKTAMQDGHHYYSLDGMQSKKPALSKEGALNICSLFKVVPSPEDAAETFHEDGHYTVRMRCHILDKGGQIVATGDGLCSTRESKYAYRWAFESELPADVNKAELKFRTGTARKTGKPYKQFQCPNQDLADSYNTVLKMADKRAMVNAVLKLPLVSELFTQDLDEQVADARKAKAETTARRQEPEPRKNAEPTAREIKEQGIKDVLKELNDLGDQIEWTGKALSEYIETQFDVKGGLDGLPLAAFDDLLDDLSERAARLAETKQGAGSDGGTK